MSPSTVPVEQPGLAVIQAGQANRWQVFRDPLAVLQTGRIDEVLPLLARINDAVESSGLYAAGYITYEAAPAFDAAMPGRPAGDLPLFWFGLYDRPDEVATPEDGGSHYGEPALNWQPSIERAAYDRAIDAIKDAIARGDTYQVNFTFPLYAAFPGDPWALFCRMTHSQRGRYGAYIDTGRHVLCSASPELFFQLDGERLIARPMKGTSARGRTLAEDENLRAWLSASAKNRAENVMIVDMVRNDMGRIARYGSVRASSLFDTERYPTVWQMTSTVECETDAPLTRIMAALFPCASITGAPKVRTMELINALEASPRGVYTGSIGTLAPGRQAQFNVAIRTVVLDRDTNIATYGVGGGIVWDSETGAEYDEALLKAQVLTRREPSFDLLETLRWTLEEGYFLLDRHMKRLSASAAYFDVPLDGEDVIRKLDALATTFTGQPQRVRLLVARSGEIRCETTPLTWPADGRILRLGLAREPVNSADPFLFHKTTHRAVYESARRSRPDCDDVLLWNERGELTESAVANLVVDLDGDLLTPPVACGLLAGTYRDWLVEQKQVHEQVLRPGDLERCQQIFLVNSVRGWQKGKIDNDDGEPG